MARTHAAHADEDPRADLGRSMCGRSAVLLIADAEPSCIRCAKIRKAGGTPRRVTWDETVREILRLLGGPAIEAYPPLREVWARTRCLRGAWTPARCTATIEDADREGRKLTSDERAMVAGRCRCELCSIDVANTPILDAWITEQQERPHRTHEHPFGSRDAALETLLRWRRDGASARSGTGGALSRCAETARLGATVQTTQRYDRDDIATRRAIFAVDIERAVRRAFVEVAERRGLPLEACVEIVVSTVDTQRPVTEAEWAERFGVTRRSVVALIAHARKVVTVELAASGYVPEPRARDGLADAIRKRREEIGEVE